MSRPAAWAVVALALLLGGAVAPGADEPVTFSNRVVRLFQRQCQECHRPGTVAPFSLTTYRDAYAWREQIREATRSRRMPPWKPVSGFGDFLDARRLSSAETALIARWVEAGAPEGDPRDLPAPRTFPATWSGGLPDVILTPTTPFIVPGHVGDLYRCFTVPTNFAETRYVTGFEALPGNRKIVHHVVVFLDPQGRSVALDEADPGPGYTCSGDPGVPWTGLLGVWAPGVRPWTMPARVGIPVQAGARVVIQVHYHNHSQGPQVETDRTTIGLTLAKGPIDHPSGVIIVMNRQLVIPAGAERHEVRAAATVSPSRNLQAIDILPHMHLLGREMKVTATSPDGVVRPLVHIDDWDFNWQGIYTFRDPVPLPGGTRIEVRALYDNSARNPRNPNSPPKEVRWGEGTTDEMCIVFLRFIDVGRRTPRGS